MGDRWGRSGDHGHRSHPASRKALEKAGWKVKDLDLVEANEAFAAQALAVNKDMGWDPAIVNVNGGAIAIGIRSAHRAPRPCHASARNAEARRQKRPCHALHWRRNGIALTVDGNPRDQRQLLCFASRSFSPVPRKSIGDKQIRLSSNEKNQRTGHMAKVAVVSGGTRGIGAAISKALKAAVHGRCELCRQRRSRSEI